MKTFFLILYMIAAAVMFVLFYLVDDGHRVPVRRLVLMAATFPLAVISALVLGAVSAVNERS